MQTHITLILVSLGNIVWSLSLFEYYLLIGKKRTKAVSSIRVITAILNILLNYFLLKRFGFGIAGINLLISNIVLYSGYRIAGRNGMRFRGGPLSFCLLTSLLLCVFITQFNFNMFRMMTMFPIGFTYLLAYGLVIYASSIFFRRNESSGRTGKND